MKLKLKVVPKASRNAVTGWLGEELKMMVTAVPEKGKANQAVIKLLAKTLGLPKQDISITSGHSSTCKTVVIAAIADTAELKKRLELVSKRSFPPF